jgi:hypothetical protein
MKTRRAAVLPPESHQLSLLFDTERLSGMSAVERSKVRLILAQILLQAAGLIIEELGDDER